jgi:hypothetical protein
MHPFVRFRLPSDAVVELGPGDIIGRSDRVALCLSEPYISEAHAMVSLRSGELRLLALRGRLAVGGKPSSQVVLALGQRIVLSSRLPLVVEDLQVPTQVLALTAEGIEPKVLAAVCSLTVVPSATQSAGSTLELVSGFQPEADAVFWTTGSTLNVRIGDAPIRALAEGSELEVGGRHLRIATLAFSIPTHAPTMDSTEVGVPLHLMLNYDTVHLIAGSQRLTLDGISARILSELAAVGAPLAWQEVAREIWGRDTIPEPVLRERWDSSLARLRRKLQAARLRTDLVHTTRTGHVELVLGPGDTMEDRM